MLKKGFLLTNKDTGETMFFLTQEERAKYKSSLSHFFLEESECYHDLQPSHIALVFDLIRNWASNKGIYEGSTADKQLLYAVEELGETTKAHLRDDNEEIIDGVGDVVVCLTNFAHMRGFTIEDAIKTAYNVISKRSGKMVNGVFKKEV